MLFWLLTRAFAFLGLVLWCASWLGPALCRGAPEGSLFRVAFGWAARRGGRPTKVAAFAALAAHFLSACFQTGFGVRDGLKWSPGLAALWGIPQGDYRTFAVVVGLPCAALCALFVAVCAACGALRRRLPTLAAVLALPAGPLVFAVFAIEYFGQAAVRALTIRAPTAADFAALAFYGFATWLLLESAWLYLGAMRRRGTAALQQQQQATNKED